MITTMRLTLVLQAKSVATILKSFGKIANGSAEARLKALLKILRAIDPSKKFGSVSTILQVTSSAKNLTKQGIGISAFTLGSIPIKLSSRNNLVLAGDASSWGEGFNLLVIDLVYPRCRIPVAKL